MQQSTQLKAMQYLFPKFKQIPLTIISGLAKGADSIAHHFAIEYQLPTIAVLGFGHMMHYLEKRKNYAT